MKDDEICRVCGKPIEPFTLMYSIGPEHWDCHARQLKEEKEGIDRMNRLLSDFSIHKKPYVRVGNGGPTHRLRELILDCARQQFPDVGLIEIKRLVPTTGAWRQARFDVRRFDGSILLDGKLHVFGSWHTITDLLKYRQLAFHEDGLSSWSLAPVLETRRTRTRKSLHV